MQVPVSFTTRLFLTTTSLRVTEELAGTLSTFKAVDPSYIVTVLVEPDVSVTIMLSTENPADGVNIVVFVLADTLVSGTVIGTGAFHDFPSNFNSLRYSILYNCIL